MGALCGSIPSCLSPPRSTCVSGFFEVMKGDTVIRPQLNEVLGHVVHARLAMDTLEAVVIEEMRAGYRPTYRGHEWDQRHYEVLTFSRTALECAFDSLKWVQFPEATFRLEDVAARLSAPGAPGLGQG